VHSLGAKAGAGSLRRIIVRSRYLVGELTSTRNSLSEGARRENETLPAVNQSMHCQGIVRMPHSVEGRKWRGIRTLRMVCCLVVWSVHNTLETPGIKGKISLWYTLKRVLRTPQAFT
jgi:hypothetical protein